MRTCHAIRFILTSMMLCFALFCAACSSLGHSSPMATQTPSTATQNRRDTLLTYTPHTDKIFFLAWSPNGKRLVTASADQTVKISDTTTGNIVLTHQTFHSGIPAVAWSDDGRYIAAGAGYNKGVAVPGDTIVEVWDATTNATLFTYRGHTSFLNSVAWSPNGTRIASAGDDKTVQVWDALTGKHALIYRGHTQDVGIIAWSPDGKKIVSASADKTVQVWDATTGATLMTLHMNDEAWGVAWSPDGKQIAASTGSFYNSVTNPLVEVWDAQTGQMVHTLTGQLFNIWSVNWSPDGKWLCAASGDGSVRIWNAASGQLDYTYLTLSAAYIAVWAPDSKRLASAGSSSDVHIWQPLLNN